MSDPKSEPKSEPREATPPLVAAFRQLTRARLALDRLSHPSLNPVLPLADQLAFQLDHARARDAVWQTAEFDRLAADLADWSPVRVSSRAPDRAAYLRRPDLGRQLAAEDVARLQTMRPAAGCDIALVAADGLSAAAINAHLVPFLSTLKPHLSGYRLAPLVLVQQGRVAVGDAIGGALGARLLVLLVGERPGLSSPDSLGIYVTYAPQPGRRDSERNCISNIHAHGLGYADAANQLATLIAAAFRQSLTGTGLRVEQTSPPVLDR